MSTVNLGSLMFVGELAGRHVEVRILGEGAQGHRPLCGSVRMTPSEWASLERLGALFASMHKFIAIAKSRLDNWHWPKLVAAARRGDTTDALHVYSDIAAIEEARVFLAPKSSDEAAATVEVGHG